MSSQWLCNGKLSRILTIWHGDWSRREVAGVPMGIGAVFVSFVATTVLVPEEARQRLQEVLWLRSVDGASTKCGWRGRTQCGTLLYKLVHELMVVFPISQMPWSLNASQAFVRLILLIMRDRLSSLHGAGVAGIRILDLHHSRHWVEMSVWSDHRRLS